MVAFRNLVGSVSIAFSDSRRSHVYTTSSVIRGGVCFLAYKYSINQGCWSLEPDTTEALECLESWFRAGCFTGQELHKIPEQQQEVERSSREHGVRIFKTDLSIL